MPLRPVKDVALRTPRDTERRAERLALAEHYALIDADMDDALNNPTTITSSTKESP